MGVSRGRRRGRWGRGATDRPQRINAAPVQCEQDTPLVRATLPP